MKKLSLLCAMALVLGALCVPQVHALDVPITVYDTYVSPGGNGWYDRGNNPGEDQETSPGTRTGQKWDLEGFIQSGTKISMVGGYNFQSGYLGYAPGDLFIAYNTGPPKFGVTTPAFDGTNQYGYNYVVKSNLNNTYTVYAITALTEVNKTSNLNLANPFQLKSTLGLTPAGTGTWAFTGGLTDAQTGFASSDPSGVLYPMDDSSVHYMVDYVGLYALFPGYRDTDSFAWLHYTYQCGNDFMMGKASGSNVPVPASVLLLGSGLLGLLGLRRFRKN
jgi:hypothetical protein